MVRRSDTVKSKIDHPIERGRQPTELGDVLEGAKVFAGHGAIGGGSGVVVVLEVGWNHTLNSMRNIALLLLTLS